MRLHVKQRLMTLNDDTDFKFSTRNMFSSLSGNIFETYYWFRVLQLIHEDCRLESNDFEDGSVIDS